MRIVNIALLDFVNESYHATYLLLYAYSEKYMILNNLSSLSRQTSFSYIYFLGKI